MTTQRNDRETDKKPGQERTGMGEGLHSREGDPRVRDRQDLRTSDSEHESGRAKDDPSRAPESGTP
jgi:hypothetical protein